MSQTYKHDLLITQDGQENHTFNEVLGRFVHNNRPTAESPDYIDVMYDEQLAGNFQEKLYDLMSQLTVEQGPKQDIDLFFTDEEEYISFVGLAFARGTTVDLTRNPAGKKWGIAKSEMVDTNGFGSPEDFVESTSVIHLHAQPFEYETDGVTYYGLRVKLRDVGVPTSTTVSAPISDLDPFQPVADAPVTKVTGTALPSSILDVLNSGAVADKATIDNMKNLVMNGSALVFDDMSQFVSFYTGLTGSSVIPTESTTTIRDFNPEEGTIEVININHFTSFDTPYYTVNGKKLNADGTPHYGSAE